MIEQINLYHACFRKKALLLSFSRMLIITLLAALSIPAMITLNTLQLKELEARSAALQVDYNRIQNEWKQISNLLSQQNKNSTLSSEAEKLKTILAHRTELLQFINNNSFDNNTGYSDYLIALARQHSRNIWLSSINIIKNGAALRIEGKISHSTILPLYLQRLSKEPILRGTQFKTLEITRNNDSKNKSSLNFVISSIAGSSL